jgi:hypothetical protein
MVPSGAATVCSSNQIASRSVAAWYFRTSSWLVLGSVNRNPFRTRSRPSSALFNEPLSSAGEHKVHSSMRLGISRGV